MSWVAVAIGGAAVGGGLYKAVSGNQARQRNKGYNEQSYQTAKKSLGVRQGEVRQQTTESLNQRGLGAGTGLTPLQRAIAGAGTHRDYTPGLTGVAAMRDKAMVDTYNQAHEHDIAQAAAPGSAHTLGEQQQVDNDKQFQLEQTDLEQQRAKAETENNADYYNTLVNAALGTVQGVAGAAGAHADLSALQTGNGAAAAGVTAPDTPASPSLYGAMTGIDNPANHFAGVVSHDPLNAFGSSWNRDKTVSGEGLANSDFHV